MAAYVVPKDKLEKFASPPGAFGHMRPEDIVKLFGAIWEIIESILDWLKEEDKKYVICKECGYLETKGGERLKDLWLPSSYFSSFQISACPSELIRRVIIPPPRKMLQPI